MILWFSLKVCDWFSDPTTETNQSDQSRDIYYQKILTLQTELLTFTPRHLFLLKDWKQCATLKLPVPLKRVQGRTLIKRRIKVLFLELQPLVCSRPSDSFKTEMSQFSSSSSTPYSPRLTKVFHWVAASSAVKVSGLREATFNCWFLSLTCSF